MINGIPDEILQDEVVKYISERHHTTARYMMTHLSDVDLEENEIQIIRGLIQMYQ